MEHLTNILVSKPQHEAFDQNLNSENQQHSSSLQEIFVQLDFQSDDITGIKTKQSRLLEFNDVIKSGESVHKLYEFNRTADPFQISKCVAFWRYLKTRPDIQPVVSPILKIVSDNETEKFKNAETQTDIIEMPWLNTWLYLKKKGLDKASRVIGRPRCSNVCDKDPWRNLEIESSLGSSCENCEKNQIKMLNDWTCFKCTDKEGRTELFESVELLEEEMQDEVQEGTQDVREKEKLQDKVQVKGNTEEYFKETVSIVIRVDKMVNTDYTQQYCSLDELKAAIYKFESQGPEEQQGKEKQNMKSKVQVEILCTEKQMQERENDNLVVLFKQDMNKLNSQEEVQKRKHFAKHKVQNFNNQPTFINTLFSLNDVKCSKNKNVQVICSSQLDINEDIQISCKICNNVNCKCLLSPPPDDKLSQFPLST